MGMRPRDIRRLRELEEENDRWKQMYAELSFGPSNLHGADKSGNARSWKEVDCQRI
jgi:hypothetical protein